jgi:hypothetical protein
MHRALVLVALLGCGNKQVENLERIRDEVCACKTPECAQAAMKRVPQDKLPSSRKLQLAAAAMMDCVAKINRSDRPSTDLDAETPAPEGSTSPGSGAPASGGTP